MPRHRRGWATESGFNSEGRHSPLSVPMLEPALLTLLKEKSSHGYTMLSDLEKMGIGLLHPSVVYRTLRDMEALHWIQSDWDTSQTQGPPRRIYRLTAAGEETLKRWQEELIKNQNVVSQILRKLER